jgi:hypothetical protein
MTILTRVIDESCSTPDRAAKRFETRGNLRRA